MKTPVCQEEKLSMKEDTRSSRKLVRKQVQWVREWVSEVVHGHRLRGLEKDDLSNLSGVGSLPN